MNSIQTRLMSIVAGGILTLLIASIIASNFLNGVINEYRRMIEVSVAQEREIHQINLNFKIQVQEWKNVLLRGQNPASFDQYWGRFIAAQEDIQRRTSQLLPQMAQGAARQSLQSFADSHRNLATLYQQGLDAYVVAGFDFSVGDAAVTGIDREPTTMLQEAADSISRDNEVLALELASTTASV